jgi:hypothetical protein
MRYKRQALSERSEDYLAEMGENVKKVLWDNVRALMIEKYGVENLNQLSRDANIAPASVMRIKDARTSVGIDIIDRVAKVFRLPAYALLVPQLQQKEFVTLCQAYSFADDIGRAYLSGAAETVRKLRTRISDTGAGDKT